MHPLNYPGLITRMDHQILAHLSPPCVDADGIPVSVRRTFNDGSYVLIDTWFDSRSALRFAPIVVV